MFPFLSMERRMAALFLLALALIAWQAARTKPLRMAPLSLAWTGGEQVFPIAAPSWSEPVDLPAGSLERYRVLYEHSALWPGVAAGGGCEIFIRTAASVWVRRGFDPERLASPGVLPGGPAGRETLRYAAQDFLDDDDGDGDVLDAGELTRSGSGAEVDAFCPPPAGGEARP
jgi:hypothetical protein